MVWATLLKLLFFDPSCYTLTLLASDMVADTPMQRTAPAETSKAENPAIDLDIGLTDNKDSVKDNSEECKTRVPACRGDPPAEVPRPSLTVAECSAPQTSMQEITEVRASGSREESRKGIDELMQEVRP